MNTFVVGSDPALKATFHSRRYGSDGWLDSYEIDLEVIDFRASVRVQNPGYEPAPTVRTIEEFLAIVHKDEYACFFG